MPADTFEQLLDRAAALSGIEPEYWDIWGRQHRTTTAATQAILKALGIAAGNAEELEHRWPTSPAANGNGWPHPPSSIRESEELELPLNIPAESLGEPARIVVRREDGTAASSI